MIADEESEPELSSSRASRAVIDRDATSDEHESADHVDEHGSIAEQSGAEAQSSVNASTSAALTAVSTSSPAPSSTQPWVVPAALFALAMVVVLVLAVG